MVEIHSKIKQLLQSQIPGNHAISVSSQEINGLETAFFTGEFWTSKQRQASKLHEIAYRACFKAQLPRCFIDLFTEPGDRVYDPFCGRGTTLIEAALMGRRCWGNDVNPLSKILTEPRLNPPHQNDVEQRLRQVPKSGAACEIDLSMFYERRTFEEICGLRAYFLERQAAGGLDLVDQWIRMIATNRLTGHSSGFFSVYTLPPNQATSQERQILINKKRNQQPGYRDTHQLILKKSRQLLSGITPLNYLTLRQVSENSPVSSGDARHTPHIPDNAVQLTVTSPPFLDIVQYKNDNWLRCWFNGLNSDEIGKQITMESSGKKWAQVMLEVLKELFRITKPSGWVAFEVGEVRKGEVLLDHLIIDAGLNAGFTCPGVVVNEQVFTKTSNIWGVDNMASGTNSNRIVLLTKTI